MIKRSLTIEQTVFEEKRLIPDLNIFLSDNCNLNCNSCMNFSSIAKNNFLNAEAYEKDICRFAEIAAEKTARIDLMGGEPLLNPDICTIMKISRKYFPKINIAIETNGMLLNIQKNEFWKTLKDTGIILRVSMYPKINDINELKQLAKNKGAVFRINADYEDWIRPNENIIAIEINGGAFEWKKFPFDFTGKQNKQFNYLNCEQHCCCALSNGKFYPCTKIPNIHHFNKYFNGDLEITENDYVDIFSVKKADEILSFLDKPVDFCRYCDVKNTKNIKWDKSNRDITEWSP